MDPKQLFNKAPPPPDRFNFTLADKKRNVYVKYISRREYDVWKHMQQRRFWSSAQCYDLAGAAKAAADALASRTDSPDGLVYGILFDPMPVNNPGSPWPDKLSPEEQELARNEFRKSKKDNRNLAETMEKGKEKLARQARHLIAFLEEKGIASKPAADTPPTPR